MDNWRDELLKDVEAYLARTGMSASEFGKAVGGGPMVVFRLRKGHGFQMRVIERIRAFIKPKPGAKKPSRPRKRSEQRASA